MRREAAMSDNVTLDRIDFEKLRDQAKRERAEYMRRYGAALVTSSRRIVPQRMGALMCARHVIAVVAILVISFGVKIFFFSPPTAEADALMKHLPAAVAHTSAKSMEIGQPPYP
jgi:hypothetical protein